MRFPWLRTTLVAAAHPFEKLRLDSFVFRALAARIRGQPIRTYSQVVHSGFKLIKSRVLSPTFPSRAGIKFEIQF